MQESRKEGKKGVQSSEEGVAELDMFREAGQDTSWDCY